jgi:hypothetical protein
MSTIEIDVQQSILKRKQKSKDIFYVEYNKLTNRVLKVTKENISPSNTQHAIMTTETCSAITSLFNSSLALHDLTVNYNTHTNLGKLVIIEQVNPEANNLTIAENNSINFIEIFPDTVCKRLEVTFDPEKFKQALTVDNNLAHRLEQMPEWFEIIAADKYEKSKLLGMFAFNTKDLFTSLSTSVYAPWLPDTGIHDIDFLYSNQSINVSILTQLEPHVNVPHIKPALVYKQDNNVLTIQNLYKHLGIFNLDKHITLFIHSANNPEKILETVRLNTHEFDNYGQVECILNTSQAVNIISDSRHLHIENANANTYYQF